MPPPAYRRLALDTRRRELLDAGAVLFAEHPYEEISMRQIAGAAGVSKALLYHYFPSKADLFAAAAEEAAGDLLRLIEPSGVGTPLEQLTQSLRAYLKWIEANAGTWSALMASFASVPEARAVVERFRTATLDLLLGELDGPGARPAALRNSLKGWLGYLDAAILDWLEGEDLGREQVEQLLLAAFGSAVTAAQDVEPAPSCLPGDGVDGRGSPGGR